MAACATLGDILRAHFDEAVLAPMAAALHDSLGLELAVYTVDGQPAWTPHDGRRPAPWTEAELRAAFERASQGPVRSENGHGPGLRPGLSVAPIQVAEGCVGFLAASPRTGPGPAVSGATLDAVVQAQARVLSELLGARRAAADLTDELANRYEELSLVYTLGKALMLSLGQDTSLDLICQTVFETLQADLLVLEVPVLDVRKFLPADPYPVDAVERLCAALRLRMEEQDGSVAVNYLQEDAGLKAAAGSFAHAAGVLLEVDGDSGGLYIFRKAAAARFYTGDVRLLEAVGGQTSIYMSNQKMTSARIQLFDACVVGLAALADSRDPETGAHLERTRRYCRVLAEFLRSQSIYAEHLAPGFEEEIFRSSPLHDIGKVGVPDSILCKPGKLTPEEFAIMQRHTVIGEATLRRVEEQLRWGADTFLTMGRQIAYCHHEKWDGSGYPRGISGESIPLAARIMAVGDVYDALTTKRCYKEAMPHEEAMDIIVRGRGSHFDPILVDAFVCIEQDVAAIREAHDDGEDGQRILKAS